TIEEVVGRQFVERMARQRNISLPSGDMFAETPVVKGKKAGPTKKAPEPQKPAAPVLPPPRLVKTAKPAPAVAPETTEAAPAASAELSAPPVESVFTPVSVPASPAEPALVDEREAPLPAASVDLEAG